MSQILLRGCSMFNKAESARRRTVYDSDAGFTLVELLVVLAIIGFIGALVAPRVLSYLGTAKVETAKIQIKNIKGALELYYLDAGSYPSTEDGLSALSTKPADVDVWNGPYLKDAADLVDPWGGKYLYTAPQDGGEPQVISLGRDKKEGGEDLDKDLP